MIDKVLKYLEDEPMRFVYIICIILSILKVVKDYYTQSFMSFDILWVGALFFVTKWLGVFEKK